jgi:ubiquinone/menaquinone biosynthesis C-methylase UbiE
MYADASFDLVPAANSLDHAHDPVAAIKAAARVVRPGGTYFLSTFLTKVLERDMAAFTSGTLE